jgi:hypothetical protein
MCFGNKVITQKHSFSTNYLDIGGATSTKSEFVLSKVHESVVIVAFTMYILDRLSMTSINELLKTEG